VPARADFRHELSLDLLGLLHGRPAAAGDLAADVALAAGERIAAGVDLDLEPVAVLALRIMPAALLAQFPVERMTRE
jgi:hypothetical protein